MEDGNILVEVRGLCYAYRERQAVREASFTIIEGEIFGFLGPNGAGKTTTISCISGQLADWRGTIRFRDQPFLPAKSMADRRRLGVVPQEIALYAELTGRENLEFFASLNGLNAAQRAESVGQALELAGLTERANDRVNQYSGGMKRRLNLVAGNLHQPELLLLDEPTVGVDPQSRNHIFEALFELRKSGRTLLYTTHYMEEAQKLCDRVAIIHEGTIVAIGTSGELGAKAGMPGANLEEVFLELTGRGLRDP